MIGYEHEPGAYKPFHLEEELGLRASTARRAALVHSSVSSVPHVGAEADMHLHGREREDGEMSGIYSDILLPRDDDFVYETGQDGLVWQC